MSQIFQGRRLAILLVAILLILSATLLNGPIRVLYIQSKAGGLLMQMTAPYPDMAVCEIPVQSSQADIDQFLDVISLLKQAIITAPKQAHSYLLLGQLYCLNNQPEQAINALYTYTDLRPENPLGYLEMGFAQFKLCTYDEQQENGATVLSPSKGDLSLCRDKSLLEKIGTSWMSIGIKPEHFINSAHESFDLQNFADTTLWYRRALKYQIGTIDELSDSDLYMWAISEIRDYGKIPDILSTRLPILETSDSITITADQLRWFREIPNGVASYGDNIKVSNIDQRMAGIVNWTGPVGVFINISQDGWYIVSVQAQNTPPVPVNLQVEKGFEPFGIISLDRGDLSWEIFQFRVRFEKGIHLLNVNYTNDAVVNEIDRNAVIEWIKLDQEN